MRRLNGFVAIAVASAVALLPGQSAAAAGPAASYASVLHAYQARGTVPACRFTSQQLASALSQIDTYGQQYYADFIAAVRAALTVRASGACSRSHLHATAAPAAGRTPRTPLPESVTAPTDAGVPAPLVVLAVLGLLLAAMAGGAEALRRGARRPWPARWSHAAAEARYRAQDRWDAVVGQLRR